MPDIPQWQKILIGALVVLVLIFGSYNYLYKPKLREIDSIKKSLSLMDSEIALVIGRDIILKKGVDIKTIVKAELESILKKIPTEKESPYIIDQLISEVGKGLKIDYNLIQPQPIVSEGKIRRLPLRANFETDYIDLNLYLSELRKLPTTVRIDEINLARAGEPPKIKVNLLLSMFMIPASPLEREVKIETKPVLIDPFFREEKKEVAKVVIKKELTLKGLWKGKVLVAFINDEAVSIGDFISGYKVVKILPDSVVLYKNGTFRTIKLGERQ